MRGLAWNGSRRGQGQRLVACIAAAIVAVLLDIALAYSLAHSLHGHDGAAATQVNSPESVTACIDGSTLDQECVEAVVAPTGAAAPLQGNGYGPFNGCPALRQNSRGECVRRVQLALRELGAHLEGTGIFGPRTQAAVVQFQGIHPPIRPSGIVGLRTQAALLKALALHRTPSSARDKDQDGSQTGARIVSAAWKIMRGNGPGWDGSPVPYVWGGGHDDRPGPGTGTCHGYDGPDPCEADQTRGLDCSGFSRWAVLLATSQDALGPGNTDAQRDRTRQVSHPRPGDLVLFGTPQDTHHVGIYIGDDQMINAPTTGEDVQIDAINHHDLVGYFRLDI